MSYSDVRQHRYHLIFIIAGIAIVIIVLGVAGALMTSIDARLKEDAEQQVAALTEQAAYTVANNTQLLENTLESFTIQDKNLEAVQPALMNLKESFGFTQVAFVDNEGNGCYADGTPYSGDDINDMNLISSSGDLRYYEPYASPEGEYLYRVERLLSIHGEPAGTLYVDIAADDFLTRKSFSIFGSEGFFFLFDANSGLVLMEPSEQELFSLKGGESLYAYLDELQGIDSQSSSRQLGQETQGLSYVERIKVVVANETSDLFVATISDIDCYVSIAPVGVTDTYICSFIPEERLRSEASSVTAAFEVIFGVVLLCLLALLVMSFFFYRRRMEEKGLEMKTHLYGALSDSLDMAVNTYSPDDGIVTPIVAKAREIIGFPMAEFIGNKRIVERIQLSEEGIEMLELIRSGEIAALEKGEFSLKDRRTGELRWVAYSVTPFFYEDKRQLLVIFRDSTSEKNLQLSMKDAMVAAETANQAKSDFLSRMSHEIRTPMNAIIGMTQIAQKHENDPEKVEKSLEKILIASDHLLNLVNDVLDISKIESGKMIMANEAFRLSEVIETVTTVIKTQCDQKNQEFSVEMQGIVENNLMGDKIRLQQILTNLLSNSVKYTPSHGHISLCVSQHPSTIRRYIQVTFVIVDDGIGMSEEYQKHIFEPFVMEGRSTSQGTGLGMPIVKNILTMINGDIQVKSVIDEGTVFTVVINFERAPNQSISQGNKGIASLGGGTQESGEGLDKEEINLDASSATEEMSEASKQLIDSAEDPLQGRGETQEQTGDKETEPEMRSSADPEQEKKTICLPDDEECTNPVSLEGIRVLLAEDNELNAEIVRELLTDAGLIVTWAQNGKEACTIFEESEAWFYDIILMDIQMPLMDGYQATEYIRNLKREDSSISIVAMSANAFMEDVQASLRMGMDAHLSKPIDIRLVFATIVEQLKGRKDVRL